VKPREVNEKRKRREIFVLIASLKRGLMSSTMLVRSKMFGLILIQGKTGANLLS
jgi:hypothetical protein